LKIEVHLQAMLPYDFAKGIERLLSEVPPEHLLGIEKILVLATPTQRGYEPASGLYVHRSRTQPARIELFVENIYRVPFRRLVLLMPVLPTWLLGRALYHEIGHHYQQFTHGVSKSAAEGHADLYGDRALRRYVTRSLRPWAPCLALLVPLYRLLYWLTHRREIRECERAVRQDPLALPRLRRLGELYYKGRFFAEAQAVWRRVLAERPEDGAANLGLGCLHWRRREFPRAIECWETAARAAPPDTRARELLRRARAGERLLGIRQPQPGR